MTFNARRFNLREHFIAGFLRFDVRFTFVRRTFRQTVLVRVSVLNRQSRMPFDLLSFWLSSPACSTKVEARPMPHLARPTFVPRPPGSTGEAELSGKKLPANRIHPDLISDRRDLNSSRRDRSDLSRQNRQGFRHKPNNFEENAGIGSSPFALSPNA